MSAAPSIRVVLGEDNLLIREGVEGILSEAHDIELVGAAGDLDSLRTAVAELEPDLVLTDIRMPPTNTDEGIRFATELRTTHPNTAVVVLSQHASSAYAMTLLADGAGMRGYALKDRITDPWELPRIVRTVAEGGTHLDPQILTSVVTGWEREAESGLKNLSPREQEVLALVASGQSNAAIAAALGITKRAVERHIGSIFAKLGLHGGETASRRVQATLVYLGHR
jgi:DNA-binding NarL/FixJ family response regulator